MMLRSLLAKKHLSVSWVLTAVLLLISFGSNAQSTTYNIAGAYTYTVAPGVYTLGFDVAGSAGGTYGVGAGGLGGRVKGNLAVTPGQVLYIYVGAKGTNGSGGAGGASAGGEGGGAGGGSIGGAGGGAACDIRTSITGGATSLASLNSRVVVGGGGGGADYDCTLRYNGGSGGYPAGGNGNGDCGGPYAQGGTQIAGGVAGTGGAPGTFGAGGVSNTFGGGGGGGWYGGGGSTYGSGGGGSSSYGAGTSAVTVTNGFQAGIGYVTLCAYPSVGVISAAPSTNICVGSTATLSTSGTASGVWSSVTPSVASLSGTTLTGVSAGTSVISYTATNVCGTAAATTTVTVLTTPGPISGTLSVCTGLTRSLSDIGTGGAWSSSAPSVASISTGGLVSGLTAGTSTIAYTNTCGAASAIVTVNTTPVISGTSAICVSTTTTLTAAPAGGTWTSGTTSVATIGSSSGVVSATVTPGSTLISYVATNGCSATQTEFVNSITPAAISGANNVCLGFTSTLSDATTGGVWSSSTPTVATISSSGLISTVAVGTTTISYSTGCGSPAVKAFTVNAAPAPITGLPGACVGQTTALTDAVSGLTWTSGSVGVATVSTTGLVTGISAGTAIITATVASTGCFVFIPVTVGTTYPSAITITPATTGTVCLGGSTSFTAGATASATLLSQNFNTGLTGAVGGTWSIINGTGNATTWWSILTPPGYAGAVTGDGSNYMEAAPDGLIGITETSLRSPSFSTVGFSAGTLEYNEYFQSYTFGDINAQVDWSTDGITWNTLVNQLGTSDLNVTWTVGTPNKTVALPAAALGQSTVYLRWYYNSNYGYYWAVDNIVVSGTSAPSYVWTGVGGATGLSCTSCATTTITPTATGANVYTVNAVFGGCYTTSGVTVSVNPLPSLTGISNSSPICAGGTFSLTATGASGVTSYAWAGPVPVTSSTSAVATVPLATAAASGTYTVTLTGGTACTTQYTTVATVNANPTIVGLTFGQVCFNASGTQNTTFTYGSTTGAPNRYSVAWSSAGPLGVAPYATLTGGTNTISGGAPAGTPAAVYTGTFTVANSTTGCSTSSATALTVNPLPAASFTVQPGPIACTGTSVAYGTQTGFALYNWIFPGQTLGVDYTVTGGSTLTNTATINWLTLGPKTVNIDNYATTGCHVVISATTNVVPAITATPTNNGPICGVGSATLTPAAPGATSYSWTGPGAYSSTQASPVVSPAVTSVYSLTASNGGCASPVATTTVVVNNPTAAPTNSGAICSTGTATLSANPAGGVTGYSWTGPGGFSSASANPTVTPTITSTYSLTVSAPGCSPATMYMTTVSVNPAPTAAPNNNGPICATGTATLTANPAGSASVYSWTGPGGYNSTVQNPAVSPTITTTYSLTVSSPGCATSPVYTTTLVVTAAPTAIAGNSGPICVPGTATLTATTSATQFSWAGPGGYTSSVQNPTVSPTATSTYSLTVSNPSCGASILYTTTVTVNNSATAAPSVDGPICNGGTIALSANPVGAGPFTYTWGGANLSSTTTQNPTATPTATTIYSLVVTTPGCLPSVQYTLAATVAAQPSVSSLTTSSSNPFCSGAVINLSVTPSGGVGTPTYIWTGPGIPSPTSGGTSTVIGFATSGLPTSGAYSVTLSYSGNGCVTSAPATTSIYTMTAQPSVSGLTSTSTNPFCTGAVITLSVSPTGGAGTPTYAWSGPGITGTATNAASALTYTTSGTATSGAYSVTLGYSGTGCATSAPATTASYSMNNQPSISGLATNSSNPFCSGAVITLSVSPTGGAGTPTYTWSGPGITGTVGNAASSLIYTTTGSATSGVYSVTLAYSGTGCVTTAPATTSTYTMTAAPLLSTLTSNSSNPFCSGAIITLSVTATGGSGTPAFTWSGPGITGTAASATSSLTYTTTGSSAAGVYSVTVAYPGTGCSVAAPATSASYTMNNQASIGSLTVTPTGNPLCAGNNVTLGSIGVTGGAGSSVYTWSGPGIATTTSAGNPSPVFTPSASIGAYSVSIAYSGTGCNTASAATAAIYTISAAPAATSVSGGGTFCGSTTISASGGGGGSIYFQGTTSGGTSTAVLSSTQVVTVTGTYYFRSQAAGGCWGPQGSVSVTINPVPSATPANNGAICIGGTVSLSAVPGPNTTVFNWSGPNLSSTSAQNPTATPGSSSIYSLTVTDGTGNPGCTTGTIYTTTVSVNTTPAAAATNSGYICAGGTATLTATGVSSSVTSYTWTGGNILTGATTSTATANPGSGPATYTLTVSDGTAHSGCTTRSTTIVTVNATPTATATNNGNICLSGTATLTATAVSGGVTSYAWNGANLLTGSSSATATASPSTPSVNIYTLTVSDGTIQPGCTTRSTTTVTVNAVPTATAANNGYICTGGTATLTATSATGGVTTYAWTGTNIITGASAATATASPSVVGTSTYTLTVSDGSGHSGCSSQSTTIATINAVPAAIATNSGYICAGGTATLTATTVSLGVTTYAWTGSSILTGASAATATANPSIVGATSYTLTVSDGGLHSGCFSKSVTVVTVNATPTATANNNGNICVGGTATLTATAVSGGVTSYAWNGANLITGSSSSTATASPLTPSVNIYTLTVSDGTTQPGCTTRSTTTVTVSATPTATATNNGYICTGGTATLTATAVSGVTNYAWTGASIVSGSGALTATAAPATVGTTVYTLTVSDGTSNSGCRTQSTTIVTVNAAATATATNSGYICAGGTATLTATAIGAGVTNYAWTGNNLVSGTNSVTATANPSAIGTTVYTLTVSDGGTHSGCTSQSTTTVTVNATPAAIATNSGFICAGGTATLTATAVSGGASSFAWTGPNILTGASLATATANPSAIGNNTYTLTVSDGSTHSGCVSKSNTVVTVNPTPTATPSNNGPICVGGTVTLTANGAGGANTFAWTGANILGSTTTNVTTANPGTNSVYTLTVSDGSGHAGCSPSTQYTTTVNVNPIPTASAINTGYICNGGTVTLAAIPANGASGFAWTGPNLAANTGISVQATPTITTTYSLTVSNGSGSGCQPTIVYTTSVIVHITPAANPANDGPICIGGAVNLAANPTATATVFTWSGANMSSTSVANPTAVPTITGTYTLVVSDGTTQSGCAPTTQYTTAVTVKTAPSLSGASNNTPICATFTLDLFANGSLNVTDYSWSGPVGITNALTANASVPSATTAASGTYTVTVNNGIGSGCAIAYTTQATVNPLPAVFSVTGGGAFCAGDTGVHVGLGGSATGITYQLYQDATAVSSLAGTGSALDFGLQTVQATYSVLATADATGCNNGMSGSAIVSVNPLPNTSYVLLGSAVHYCMGGTGILMTLNGSDTGISYQLYLGSYTTGSALEGTGSALNFGYQTGGGNYVALATNIHTGCNAFVSGIADVIIDSLPRIYSLTGGGSYCANGTGVNIGLDNSQPGVTYIMTNSGDLTHPVTRTGTGGAIDFGMQTAEGTLTVTATNSTTTCSSTMSGHPAISINPLPNIYSISGGGTYCEGTGGVEIFMNVSDTGVYYYLYNGPTLVDSVAGIGGLVSFGAQTAAGTYSASATRIFTGCTDTMALRAEVIENLAPTIYTVTGGGQYCSVDTGKHIGLASSDTGVTYTLYNSSTSLTSIIGSGTSLDFGMYAAGSYSVSARNNITGCTSSMSGIRSITENMTPVAYTVGGSGQYCAGGTGIHITLSSSDTGVNYNLYLDGALTTTIVGTNSNLDFGAMMGAGTYTVEAVNATSGCTNAMSDSAVVVVVTPVTPSITLVSGSGDTTCAGTSVTFTATGVNGGTTPVYAWYVNTVSIPAATSTDYTFVPANGDIVKVVMISSAACAMPDTVSASTTMTVLEQGTPGVTINVNPGANICAGTTVTFTAVPAFGGTHPTFSWKVNGVFVYAGPEFSYAPLNGENVSVVMTSDYPCVATDTASAHVVMNVGEAIAPTVEIVATPGTSIMEGALDTLTAYVTSSGPVTYQWLVNNTVIAGATNSVFIQSFSNNDSVTCQATSANGCALTGFNTVIITVVNVGVQPVVIGNANIRLIPNPNNGEFYVNGVLGTTADQDVSLEVTDMLGQVIYKGHTIVHGGSLNEKLKLGNTLANGMYMMNVSTGTEHKVFHFVIEQ